MPNDLLFQQLSTVQSDQQPVPNTVASAATLAPTTFLTFVTGTVAVATITPPVTGTHLLLLIYTDATPTAMTTSGNILNLCVPTQNQPTLCVYDPVQRKYYAAATNIT